MKLFKFIILSLAMTAWFPFPVIEAKPATGKARLVDYRLSDSVGVNLRDPCSEVLDPTVAKFPLDKHRHRVKPEQVRTSGLPYHMLERFDSPNGQLINMVHHYTVTRPYDVNMTSAYLEGIHLLTLLHGRIKFLKQQVLGMIDELEDCLDMDLPELVHMQMPTFQEGSNIVPYMESVYTVLANQTAHLYFLHDLKAQPNCGIQRQTATDLYLAAHYHRILMCHFLKIFDHLKIQVDRKRIADEVLDHRFSIGKQCYCIQLIDCQVMKNSVQLLDGLIRFLWDHSPRLFVNVSMTEGLPVPMKKFLSKQKKSGGFQ